MHDINKPSVCEALQVAAAPKSIQDVRVQQDLVGLVGELLVREELLQKLPHAAAELSNIMS